MNQNHGKKESDGRESRDSSIGLRPALGPMHDTHLDLGKVYHYPGAMAVLVDALKKKGVRFDESGFKNGEIAYLKKNIVVLRGSAYEIVHHALQSVPSRISRKKPALNLGGSSMPILAGGVGLQ